MKGINRLIDLLASKIKEIGLGLSCIVFIFACVYFKLPGVCSLIEQFDNQIYDRIISLNWHPHKTIPHVVIIDIDEESVVKEGRWPWPRDKIADLLIQLKKAGVVTIAMDMVLSEAEINYALGLKHKLEKNAQDSDKQLLDTLTKIAPSVDNDEMVRQVLLDHSVVLGFLFHNDEHIKTESLPKPLLDKNNVPFNINQFAFHEFVGYNGVLTAFMNAATQGGFVSNIADSDGTVRHALLLASHENKLYPSLALAAAMNYLLTDKIRLATTNKQLSGIYLDQIFIPTNKIGQILLPFWGKAGTQDYYSATDILQRKVDMKALQGGIAVIGSSMILLSDIHRVPVAQSFPGVEMVGNMIQALVSQQIITAFDVHTLAGAIYLLLLGIIFALLFPFLGIISRFIVLICTIVAILATVILLFVYKNTYIPSMALITLIFLQALVNYAYSFFHEKRQKRLISTLFGQYVPPDYVKELIEFPDKFSMEGKTRDLTIQFIDIRDFTTVCEKLDANGVKHLLNTFFTPVTEIIFKHRGTIDKYVGDMIMAFWGAPIEDDRHAYQAIAASLAIFQYLPIVNAHIVEQNLPLVNIGIGLASGMVNVGDMGSEFRRAYTVLGDTVNLASRLQDLTKYYQVNILVNEATRINQDEFLWQIVDKVTVKGRTGASTIYEPLCLIAEASSDLLTEIEQYTVALEHYYSQQWTQAQQQFEALQRAFPKRYLYTLYLQRVRTFMTTPPPENWDGVYIHTQK